MNRLLSYLRKSLRVVQFDIVRYPTSAHEPILHFLKKFAVDTVLDVGANAGQYADYLRNLGYSGHILSFEPNPEAFKTLQHKARKDEKWTCLNYALGEYSEEMEMNIAALSEFSSILEPTRYLENLDNARIKKKEKVLVRTLDDVWRELGLDGRKVLLKIDTQGYERQVLLGASKCLSSILGLQLEMSFQRIYVNQPQVEDMIPFIRERGFHLFNLWRGFFSEATEEVLEIEGLFFRTLGNTCEHIDA